MKKYEQLTEEELVDKLIRAKYIKDVGFGLKHRDRQKKFNEYWKINVSNIISEFNRIQDMVEKLNYLNEELVCDFCGNNYLRKQHNVKNKSGKHFCSVACGMRYSKSFSTNIESRKALSLKMKQLLAEGKIKIPEHQSGKKLGPNNKKFDSYMKNPKLCIVCNSIIPYERRESSYCCKEHAPHGGLRRGSSHGKKGWYKGFWCDSSWELAFVIYNLEHNIYFQRNHEYFEYQFKGKTYKYYPDFCMKDKVLIEIKGYNSRKWQAKLKAFPSNRRLKVLYRSDMKPMIDYVINKYGKNFVDLYE